MTDNCSKCGCPKSWHHAKPTENNPRTCYGIACQCPEKYVLRGGK